MDGPKDATPISGSTFVLEDSDDDTLPPSTGFLKTKLTPSTEEYADRIIKDAEKALRQEREWKEAKRNIYKELEAEFDSAEPDYYAEEATQFWSSRG